MSSRRFTPYELNQLRKYGVENIDPSSVGDKPVEYLTGHVEFYGHDFTVSEHTLIPRIESEEIVKHTTDFIKDTPTDTPLNLADIGTGSGCLGISTAIKLNQLGYNNINLYLSDISPLALKVASLNSSKILPPSIKTEVFQSDLLDQYPKNIKLNIIIANLPYIPSKDIPNLDSSVRNYEPHLALDGGPQGTTIINQLLKQITDFTGQLFLSIFEINDTHIFEDFDIPKNLEATLKKDSFGHNRFLIIKTHNIDILPQIK